MIFVLGLRRLMGAAVAGLLVGCFMATVMHSEAEATHCASETINGNSGENSLYSNTDRASTLNGFGAADYLRGYECGDTMNGGDGPDNMHGAFGYDVMKGEGGHENANQCSIFFVYCGEVLGGGDGDRMEGNDGSDYLDDTSSGGDIDDAVGGLADDTLKVNDGDTQDLATGGAGTDACPADSSSEKGSDCES